MRGLSDGWKDDILDADAALRPRELLQDNNSVRKLSSADRRYREKLRDERAMTSGNGKRIKSHR